MDRVIEVKVNGNYLTKDGKNAGVRGEANATILRITFDEGWKGYGKRIFFIDALGGKPVSVVISPAHWENAAEETNVYLVPIPKEPLEYTGTMTFVIEGTKDNKVQRSITDELEVKDSPDTSDAVNSVEPTPSELQQMQEQIEGLSDDIQEAYAAKEGAEAAKGVVEVIAEQVRGMSSSAERSATAGFGYSESARESALRAEEASGKVSYIGDNGNWFAWDAEKGEFYDTGVRAQAGSTVYMGDNPPEDADVWINTDEEGVDVGVSAEEFDAFKDEVDTRTCKTPQMYGAKGSGGTDDTQAFQDAIDDISASGGGTLFVPSGTYKISGTIYLKKSVSIKGENQRTTELRYSGTGALIDTSNITLSGLKISDLTLFHAGGRGGIAIKGGSTLENYNSANFTCFNLCIIDFDYGIYGAAEPEGVGLFDSLFIKIWFQNCGYGFYCCGSANTYIYPRITHCDAGFALRYLNGESYDGGTVIGGVLVSNDYDVSILDKRGIRPFTFNGTWFEQSNYGVLNIVNEDTDIRQLSFYNCMLNSHSTEALFNANNALYKDSVSLYNCIAQQTRSDASMRVEGCRYENLQMRCNGQAVESLTNTTDKSGGGVGQATDQNGEIFNDYDNNRALYTNNHAEGANTTAGFTGYKMLKVTANGTSSIDIEVRDKDLTKKASSAYVVGDKINFEAQLHWAEIATINSFSASADGNTVINVTYFTQHGLDASDDEAENWLSVTGKEGGEPIAQYHSAHAEGEDTIAAGRSAHAEGRNTKVIGNHGHAEGRNTIAGYCAHAEGKGAEALADSSHAEGNSRATGMRAHAENSNTEARGAHSHSEGLYTVAASGSQHVQGKYNEIDSLDKYAHIVGGGTGTAEEQRKNIHTLDWNGNGWFAGDVTVGSGNRRLIPEDEAAGRKVNAGGGEVFNDYANNNAIGSCAHAEGYLTVAGRKAFKIYSVDREAKTFKLDSVAGLEVGDVVSYNIRVSGDGVLTPGWTSIPDATEITGIDSANKTIKVGGINSAITNELIKDYSTNGYVGLWVNKKPEAGTYTGAGHGHAEGVRAWAIGGTSHAEGNKTVASGVYAHAEGDGSIASGESSHAEGAGCLAKGMRSHAEGGDTEARGSYSHSEGWHTITKGIAQHAEGIANEEMGSDYLHIVGNGSVIIKDGVKTVNRSNAYTLDKKGNGWYAGTVEASGIILRSTNKKFLLTIDDSGTLKATEVK